MIAGEYGARRGARVAPSCVTDVDRSQVGRAESDGRGGGRGRGVVARARVVASRWLVGRSGGAGGCGRGAGGLRGARRQQRLLTAVLGRVVAVLARLQVHA